MAYDFVYTNKMYGLDLINKFSDFTNYVRRTLHKINL